ncbi:hypothetical protein FRC12_015251 [Ceratobasidium sp. 428]|nr:hypothetical protein FRC12_015251 [Ceratobasidium sp. 428]
MDQAWLATLTDIQKEMFEFNDHEYDFDDFPMELLDEPYILARTAKIMRNVHTGRANSTGYPLSQ